MSATKTYADSLFRFYATFLPTQALYLDLEGGGGGTEEILSVYWPFLPGPQRFSWIRRTSTAAIDSIMFNGLMHQMGVKNPRWVVVFSGGQALPDERDRVADLLGDDPFPDADWINLHYVLRNCREIKTSIREHRYVWFQRDRTRTRYSLEALELEFGLTRPSRIRAHSNCYSDLNGENGEMEILSIAQRVKNGSANEDEAQSLREYCEADVVNMFKISLACERMLFSRDDRVLRRRMYS